MAVQAHRHTTTGVVILAEEGSTLAELVAASGAYEPAELEDLAVDVPALDVAATSPAKRDEANGWLTPPGVAPAPITGAVAAPAAPADPLVEVLAGTTEEVNAYLDEVPEDQRAAVTARVLELEAAGKARKGILAGRHGEQPAAGGQAGE